MLDACLKCAYSREGIDHAAPCPECGDPAPPVDWLVLRGWSTEGYSWIGLVGGTILLAAGLAVALLPGVGARMKPWGSVVGVLMIAAVAIIPQVRRWRARVRGCDTVWIVESSGLEIRTSVGQRFFTNEELRSWHIDEWLGRRHWRLALRPRRTGRRPMKLGATISIDRPPPWAIETLNELHARSAATGQA